jgi:hypothetical protein
MELKDGEFREMTVSIWSVLLKSESITEIYVPPGLEIDVSLEDFYQVLNKQMEDKGVANANLTIEDVLWDEGRHSQRRIVARYTGSDAPKNIQQILIGLDDMGSFRYVEEKTFLSRPELPKFPKSKVEEPTRPSIFAPEFTRLIWGIGIVIVSLLMFSVNVGIGLVGLVVGGVWIALYFKAKTEYDEAEGSYQSSLELAQKSNREAEAETRAWNAAWDSWNENVLETAYLQATTNSFGRFQRSVASCVRLTVTELFEDKKAELKDTKAREINEQQIEDQLKKKRESFK